MLKDQVVTETSSWVVNGLHRGAAIRAALDQNAGRRGGSDPEAVVAVEIVEELGGKNDLGESEYRVEVTYEVED